MTPAVTVLPRFFPLADIASFGLPGVVTLTVTDCDTEPLGPLQVMV